MENNFGPGFSFERAGNKKVKPLQVLVSFVKKSQELKICQKVYIKDLLNLIFLNFQISHLWNSDFACQHRFKNDLKR